MTFRHVGRYRPKSSGPKKPVGPFSLGQLSAQAKSKVAKLRKRLNLKGLLQGTVAGVGISMSKHKHAAPYPLQYVPAPLELGARAMMQVAYLFPLPAAGCVL